MITRSVLWLGILAILMGAAKIAHSSYFGAELISGTSCLGNAIEFEVSSSSAPAHCWGCYAIGLGLANIVLLAVFNQLISAHPRRVV